jgi:hypothetical protein
LFDRSIRAMRAHSYRHDSPDMNRHATSAAYEIRVRGVLSETLLVAFPNFQARSQDGDTILTGSLADQAALYGVLGEIEALGLELLEVRRPATQQ